MDQIPESEVIRRLRAEIVVLGLRRVGKTVLIHHAIAELLAGEEAPGSIAFAVMPPL